MDTATIAKFGMLFLLLGFSATFLMYHLWGYPFDKQARKSAAPKWAMLTHRVIGYLFVGCYVVLMSQMLPRLWHYQVEFPARTVVHVALGFSVGFLLLVKIAILRFFRHFEEWMPFLGTVILFCTVLLIGFSVPFVFKERALAEAASGGNVYGEASLQRVARLLPAAGLPADASLEQLATEKGLRAGRQVLLNKCVRCHDLKTILTKPRTPSNWYRTVNRMADKPTLFEPFTDTQQWQVTAYLVAITPDLQRSQKQLRTDEQAKEQRKQDMLSKSAGDLQVALQAVDPAKAKEAFQEECSQCHELSDVDEAPPKNDKEIDQLMERMIENGLETEPQVIRAIKWYLDAHYIKKTL